MCAAIALVGLGGCSSDLCENAVVSRKPSPDEKNDAVSFQRSCGSTTGNAIEVSILPRQATPAAGGNLFIADDNHGEISATVWVEWRSPTILVIAYDRRARVFKKETGWGAIKIEYAPK